ncbi:MAG: hypothetical protein N3B21_03610 [Clostridia bacterium]|nr:hypothetical protein [Clostridia bacterium]
MKKGLMFMHSRRKGKILKVRLGYNANSSSIATIVSVFIWGSAAVALVINMISAALFIKTDKEKAGVEEECARM